MIHFRWFRWEQSIFLFWQGKAKVVGGIDLASKDVKAHYGVGD